jgi:hypothetical protein
MLANENLSNDLKLLSHGGRVVVSMTSAPWISPGLKPVLQQPSTVYLLFPW